MKKLLLLPLLMGLSLGLFAQKYAYIDSEYILGNIASDCPSLSAKNINVCPPRYTLVINDVAFISLIIDDKPLFDRHASRP